MGKLVEGRWVDQWYDTSATGGRFVRESASFHHWITPDGSAGSGGEAGFEAVAGRYHLYVSYACPWAHRTLIFRKLKRLEDIVDVSVVSPLMLDQGWSFNESEGSSGDACNGFDYLHQLYTAARGDYTGRVTVPVLFDRERNTIVNNESSEIIRIFNSAFDGLTGNRDDYYPEELREVIDTVNDDVYRNINNGVYRAGFATTQEAYEQAYAELFAALDRVESILARQRYLAGRRITEADWRLLTTILRFDAVYYSHFKCNRQRIEDFPNLSNYLRELYQWPGIAETVHLDHIKRHYYYSHDQINPTRIVPQGPQLDFTRPHDRARLPASTDV